MRVAMLTYSVKPRGGVVHALAVAEALAGRGHDVELFALGAPGRARSSARRAVPAHLVRARRRPSAVRRAHRRR